MPARPAKSNPAQEELALSSVAPHRLFPGRTTLYLAEVAGALSITSRQVADLITGGDLMAINISASRGAGKSSAEMTAEERRKVPRTHWRVPVSAYDAFLQSRRSA
jgi:hypothetical protein